MTICRSWKALGNGFFRQKAPSEISSDSSSQGEERGRIRAMEAVASLQGSAQGVMIERLIGCDLILEICMLRVRASMNPISTTRIHYKLVIHRC